MIRHGHQRINRKKDVPCWLCMKDQEENVCPSYLPDVLPYHMKLDHKKLIVNYLSVEGLSSLGSIPSSPKSSSIIPTIQECR